MRRALSAGLVGLVTTATVLLSLPVATAAPALASSTSPAADQRGRLGEIADRALAHAQSALDGAAPSGRDVTVALRDLRVAYRNLSPADQQRADALLDRPYPGGSVVCGPRVCVHYATGRGTAAQATATVGVMESVYSFEVGQLGYRAPASDGATGGTVGGATRFDVYLDDLGNRGIYGYCSPETLVAGQPDRATAFCALDDDFAEFPRPGDPSRRVTAAHEFFHAVQFNYDFREDPWVLEATAVWMEEQYADDVNDSRQYLSAGQLRQPGVPLDVFDTSRLNFYGNWIFFQRLSQTYGQAAVRVIWQRLDGTVGAPDQYSVQGIAGYLRSRGTRLRIFYPDFAAGDLVPGRIYDEGSAYAGAPLRGTVRLTRRHRTRTVSTQLSHLTSRSYAVLPRAGLKGNWRLRIALAGPKRTSGAGAFVTVVSRSGAVARKRVFVKRNGHRTVRVDFSRSQVARVYVTIANAGIRYRCFTGEPYACSGTPLSDGKRWKVRLKAVKGGS